MCCKCEAVVDLSVDCEQSGTHLLSSLWFLDSPTGNGVLKDTGYATRLNYRSNNKTIELYGRLHANAPCSFPIKC
jgi:hypothetical protein